MSHSPPRRHFLPEVVETSTRSSKRPHHEDPSHTSHVRFAVTNVEPLPSAEAAIAGTRPRHFLPQPIEESARTSRKPRTVHTEDNSKRRELDGQIDTTNTSSTRGPTDTKEQEPTSTKPAARRFAPEPVETSIKSSRRKFAPEPIGSTTRSSKDKRQKEHSESSPPPARRKFLPEPVETTSTRRRRKPMVDEDDPPSEAVTISDSLTPTRTSSGGRKFTPELLETAKGSYRRNQVSSGSSSPKDKAPSSSSSTAGEASDAVPELQGSRFSAANLAKRQHQAQRQHSFHVPNLPIIESDGSDDDAFSGPPSLSQTSSDSELTDSKQLSRIQTNEDSYTDYVLRLAAQSAAEKQLQDQAMAAYINERPHEPVDHFAFDREDEDGSVHVGRFSGEHGTDIRTFRRESAADLDWELANMRRHHEQLEQMKRDFKENTAGQSRFSAAALISRQNHGVNAKGERIKPKKGLASVDGEDEDSEWKELKKMRTAASPPMLGGDLVFPFTISPKMTRCDVDQVPRPRTAESDDEGRVEGDPQLWNANVNIHNNDGAGLWMGMCQKTESGQVDTTRPITPMRSGLQTPAYEIRNPLETATPHGTRAGTRTPGGVRTPGGARTPGRGGRPASGGLSWLPLTPPREKLQDREKDRGIQTEDLFTASIDKKLNLERQIEDEFPNRVITQIYNYLSLGYPSLAHPFDEELSKISRITVEELRKDDLSMDAKGYVGAPEGDGVDDDFVEKGRCRRWEALRSYVIEWARQSPQFKEEVGGRMKQGGGDWGAGARVRRGSWAH